MSDDTRYLPATVAVVGSQRLQEAALAGDPGQMETVIAWGLEIIDRTYDPDALWRPLDGLRRHFAQNEWRALVRQMERRMLEVMATKQVDAFTYELDRRIEERRYQDGERRRRQTITFDTDEMLRFQKGSARIARKYGQPQSADQSLSQQIIALSDEIARVNGDPALSEEQKHHKTRALQTSMNRLVERETGERKR